MVNFLTQQYTYDQLVRLEHAVELFIKGKIDRDTFIRALILKTEQGGVEMLESEAKKMAATAEKLIHQADDIRRFRAKKDNDDIFFSQHKLAERLRDHLLQANHIKLNKEQNENLVEMIADRVTGVVEEDQFNERLLKGLKSGGLSLDVKEADDLTRYFEKIIAQGVDVSYKS
jgi:hypothetical protein